MQLGPDNTRPHSQAILGYMGSANVATKRPRAQVILAGIIWVYIATAK